MVMLKKTVATICYPDDPDKHIQGFIDLLEHYNRCDGGARDVIVRIGVEDGNFVVKVGKGFDCLHIPVEDVIAVVDSVRKV